MSTFPTISFKEFMRALERLGFQKARQRGSHIRFVHQDGRKTTVPDHGNRDVPEGLLRLKNSSNYFNKYEIINYDTNVYCIYLCD